MSLFSVMSADKSAEASADALAIIISFIMSLSNKVVRGHSYCMLPMLYLPRHYGGSRWLLVFIPKFSQAQVLTLVALNVYNA